VRSSFPSKIASFFDYGTVDVLTEGDTQAMMGTMNMYYVTDPDGVVANIQSLLDAPESEIQEIRENMEEKKILSPKNELKTKAHTIDTRGKIRDVLR